MNMTEGADRGRTIVVGDVHGCRDEVERLLDRVHYDETRDRLFFLGDLLSRGPDPRGVLAIVRRTGARSVRGNHDDVLLRWRAAKKAGGEAPLAKNKRKLAEELEEEDWAVLESLELWIDVPSHDLRLVHAGVIPGVPIESQPIEALLSMRYLGPNDEPIEKLGIRGAPVEKDGTVLWGRRYVGPPHIVFGHNAQNEPQLHPWATGIDTGVVYGERLTALVLQSDQRVPPPERRGEVLFSVRARDRYYVPPDR